VGVLVAGVILAPFGLFLLHRARNMLGATTGTLSPT
jgi:hypothetical protein